MNIYFLEFERETIEMSGKVIHSVLLAIGAILIITSLIWSDWRHRETQFGSDGHQFIRVENWNLRGVETIQKCTGKCDDLPKGILNTTVRYYPHAERLKNLKITRDRFATSAKGRELVEKNKDQDRAVLLAELQKSLKALYFAGLLAIVVGAISIVGVAYLLLITFFLRIWRMPFIVPAFSGLALLQAACFLTFFLILGSGRDFKTGAGLFLGLAGCIFMFAGIMLFRKWLAISTKVDNSLKQ